MALNNRSFNPNDGVRRVIIITEPVLYPQSAAANASKDYFCKAIDMKGFQIEIDLQALPPGVTYNQIKINQVWWVEKRTTRYRLYLYGGNYDPEYQTIDSTDPLPPSTSNVYYANFYSTSTQTTASANAIQPFYYNNATDAFGFYIVSNGGSITFGDSDSVNVNNGTLVDGTSTISGSKMYFQYAGIYNVQFSAQYQSSNASSAVVNTWIRQNGADIPWTAGEITLAGGGLGLPSWNYIVTAAMGDYVELMWSADTNKVSVLANRTPTVGPGIPSIVTTIIPV